MARVDLLAENSQNARETHQRPGLLAPPTSGIFPEDGMFDAGFEYTRLLTWKDT
jgi:hypothetical protein